ncbi:hypothetical protein GCM10027202_35190 [Microvirgula curvata]
MSCARSKPRSSHSGNAPFRQHQIPTALTTTNNTISKKTTDTVPYPDNFIQTGFGRTAARRQTDMITGNIRLQTFPAGDNHARNAPDGAIAGTGTTSTR